MNMTPVAQAVQAQGRGKDSMLVHMTPNEVAGLQALAMRHGGSLSINPKTGLPEAGFLDNLLPTVLGVALTPFMGPLAAGLTVGGIQTVRTGDIGKGFLAGLGAYGGANLAGGLMQAATQPAQQAAMANVAAEQATNQAIASGVPVVGSDTGVTGFLPGSEGGVNQIMNAYTQNVPQTIGQQYSAMGKGFTDVLSSGDTGTAARSAFMDKLGGTTGAIKTAGMAGAPIIADALTPKPYEFTPTKEESNYAGPYKPSERRVSYPGEEDRRRTSEFTYFSPSNPIPFAEGGESSSSASAPDVVVSPNEARVYQDILNVQRLAGLPALDPNRFFVTPGRSYEQYVYNPIEGAGGPALGTGEKDYGIKPLMSKAEVEAALAKKNAQEAGEGEGFSGVFGMTKRLVSNVMNPGTSIVGYTRDGAPVYSQPYNSFNKGGSVPQLEDGGFVLTKKAVDGLGKGSNKKGQENARRGLGAIPIKGPGTGTSDSIKTNIDGKHPALISNGEAYVPKRQVAKRGGAKAFYALMNKAEKAADRRKRA